MSINPNYNPDLFTPASTSFEVSADRKATQNPDGTWKNAIGLESTEEHRHVAKAWQDRCTPLPEFRNKVIESAKGKTDELAPEGSFFVTDDLDMSNGYKLTESGIESLRMFTDIPSTMISWLKGNEFKPEVAKFLNHALAARLDAWSTKNPDKPRNFLLRLRDGDNDTKWTRAICSDRYGIIDNNDVMEMICAALPGGYSDALASHAYDNGDDVKGNILLPDYIKTQPDSDYGVGIAFRNSEVRKSTFVIDPFLFRAICFNGCIWGRANSVVMKVNKKHLGQIDLVALKEQVRQSVLVALSHGNDLLNQFSQAKNVSIDTDPVRLIASLSRDNGLTIEQGMAWVKGYNDSLQEASGDIMEGTAFGIVNGLTLAAQRFSAEKYDLETVAGNVLTPSLQADLATMTKRWDSYATRAASLDDKIVEKYNFVSA